MQAIRNLSSILEAAGSSLKHVIKVNVYLTTMDNFAAMNQGYAQCFEQPFPVSQVSDNRFLVMLIPRNSLELVSML